MNLPRKTACRLFVHGIATYKVQGCELELAKLGYFCRSGTRTWTRKIKFLELELANISRTRLKIKRVRSPEMWPAENSAETKECGPPPRNHLSGPPKFFFLDRDTKERAPKGQCQAKGVWGHVPQKILRNLTLFWRLFVRFEPLKFLNFNKVW